MHRFIAILLLVLVPIQFSWSMALSLHGHLDGDASMLVLHKHPDGHQAVDDHDGEGLTDFHSGAVVDGGDNSTGHGEPTGHFHPIFSTLVYEPVLEPPQAASAGPHLRWAEAFTSHIPSQFDRPPLVLL